MNQKKIMYRADGSLVDSGLNRNHWPVTLTPNDRQGLAVLAANYDNLSINSTFRDGIHKCTFSSVSDGDFEPLRAIVMKLMGSMYNGDDSSQRKGKVVLEFKWKVGGEAIIPYAGIFGEVLRAAASLYSLTNGRPNPDNSDLGRANGHVCYYTPIPQWGELYLYYVVPWSEAAWNESQTLQAQTLVTKSKAAFESAEANQKTAEANQKTAEANKKTAETIDETQTIETKTTIKKVGLWVVLGLAVAAVAFVFVKKKKK